MEKFCRFCGKELILEACECEEFIQAQKEENEKLKNVACKVYKYGKKVGSEMLSILKKPVDGIGKKEKNRNVSYTIGAIAVLVVYITNIINPMFLGYYWNFGLKVQVALWMAAIPALIIVLTSLVTFLFSKKGLRTADYKEALATFCVATAPFTIFYSLGYLFSFISIAVTIFFLFLSLASWLLLCSEATAVVLDGNRNLGYWVMFLITLLTIIIIGCCGVEIMMCIVTGVMEIFQEYIGNTVEEIKLLVIDCLNNLLLGGITN